MNIFDNPFYILGVSAKSNRRQISDKAEEKIFLNENESKSINEARNTLIMPDKRLAAEIRWFPGVSDKNIAEIIGRLKSVSPDINLGEIASLNFAVYSLSSHNSAEIIKIAQSLETINLESLCETINNDRKESGFPSVKLSELEREFNNYRIDIVKTLSDKLAALPRENYIKLAYELAENFSRDNNLLILGDLIDSYELNIMPELEILNREIIDVAANIHDKLSGEIFDNLDSMLEKWQELSKPVIFIAQIRAIDFGNIYKQAQEIFAAVRENAINLNNQYCRTEDALKLIQLLKKYFAVSDRFTSIINQDISRLDEIIKAKYQEALRIEAELEEVRRAAEQRKAATLDNSQ